MTWEQKPDVARESINTTTEKKNIDKVNKSQKPQASKIKKINPSEINQSKVNHWINQGLLKELKQKTQ